MSGYASDTAPESHGLTRIGGTRIVGNQPDTYYLLVTLPEQPGEWVDTIIEDLEDAVQTTHQAPDATVTYLTPETLPERYVERGPVSRGRTVTIHTPEGFDLSEQADYIRLVADQIEDSYSSGHVAVDHHWTVEGIR